MSVRERRARWLAKHPNYMLDYRAKNRDRMNAIQREWNRRNPERRRAIQNRWVAKHSEYYATHHVEYDRKRNARNKRKALEMLGGAKCARCGVDDIRFLEVNHVNGEGGGRERVAVATTIHRAILARRVDITKLNVLCKVCNALEFLERKFPDIVGRFDIKWRSE